MKRLSVFLIILIAFLSLGCKKPATTTATATDKYRGVIVKNICCQVVVQAIGGSLIGQAWVDGPTAYSYVFKVSNPCQFGNHVAGDTINFRLVAAEVQNCACCMIYTSTPDTAYAVEVVN